MNNKFPCPRQSDANLKQSSEGKESEKLETGTIIGEQNTLSLDKIEGITLWLASHLSQSDANTAKTSTPNLQEWLKRRTPEIGAEGWPSIEEQMEYWKTHDHGGNVLPSRIGANEEQYGE